MPNTLILEVRGASRSALHFGASSADGLGFSPHLCTAGIYGINISLHQPRGVIVKSARVWVSGRKFIFLQGVT